MAQKVGSIHRIIEYGQCPLQSSKCLFSQDKHIWKFKWIAAKILYLLEGLMLKLKLQYFGHLMWAVMGKALMLGKTERKRSIWRQRMRRLGGITDSTDMNLGKPWEMVRDREAWCAVVHGGTKSWTKLGDWTTTTIIRFRAHPDMVKNLLAKQETQVWSLGWSLGEGNGNPL